MAKTKKEATVSQDRDRDREANEVSGKTSLSGTKTKATPKLDSPVPVQVVTMRKARPSETSDRILSRSGTAEASTSSRSSRRSEVELHEQEHVARTDRPTRQDDSLKSSKRGSSSASTKQAAVRKSDDDPADSVQRKRRRTNDFTSSDPPSQHRERRRTPSPEPGTPRSEESFSRRREPSRDGSIRRVEPPSPREAQTRGGIPVSASMPSFTSSASRLPAVSEVGERESNRPRAGEYHDRRRDRSYDDDAQYDDYAPRDRNRTRSERSYQDDDGERRGRRTGEDARESRREPSSSSSAAKAPPASVERPIKGVGPGATHWSEPWLDVRSKSDWHRLAQRFAKAQEEYLASRKRLEAESERLDRELELASMEEREAPRPYVTTGDTEIRAEQSLLFSPHKHPASDADQPDLVMRDLEEETAINTSINSRTRCTNSTATAKAKPPAEDGDESPEEGEMRSSDDEDGGRADVGGLGRSDTRSPGTTTSSVDSVLLASRRSESPDNIAWRSGATAARSHDGADRPLSYTDLANRVQQLGELHGSLSRMHRVLVDFKAKGHYKDSHLPKPTLT